MNNYHIYEEIGRGKYSVVYKGRKKKTIQYVAVKSVERCRRKKLMNEVRIFHNLDHHNILKFHNWYETRNHLWIIFEYCPGGDLLKLIEEDRKLPEQTVKKMAYELVQGLSYLHENGIIYADLKPTNILINEFSNLKLGDFGLSKKISDLMQSNIGGDAEGNKKGSSGTPYYMAPELFQDDGVLSFYSDFWSLGCIMYELAVGKPPFCASSLQQLIQMIFEADAPSVSNFSDDFNDLVKSLLEKDPTRRMNWHDLKQHPFWYSTSPVYQFSKNVFYPEQPQFDKYLIHRGINPKHFYDQQNNPLAAKFANPDLLSASMSGGHGQNGVDIMRLSMNVKRNMLKEQEMGGQGESEDNYHTKNNQPQDKNGANQKKPASQVEENAGDINLKDRNVVINFAEEGEEDSKSEQQVQNEVNKIPQQVDSARGGKSNQTSTNMFYPSTTANTSNLNDDQSNAMLNQVAAVEDKHAQPLSSQKSDRRQQNHQTFGSSNEKAKEPNSAMQRQQNNFLSDPQNAPALQKTNSGSASGQQKSGKSKSPTMLGDATSTNTASAINILDTPMNSGPGYNSKPNTKTFSMGVTGQSSSSSSMMDGLAAGNNRPPSSQNSASKTQVSGRAGTGRKGSDQRNKSADRQLADPNSQANALNVRKYATKKRPVPQVHLNSSPQDLTALAENRLFQSYQAMYYEQGNAGNSDVSSAGASTPTPMLGMQQNQFGITIQSPANTPMTGMSHGQAHQTLGGNTPAMKSASASAQPKTSKVPHKPIEQLIIHNSDNQVKPIIGNKEIEKVQEVSFNPENLTFQPWDHEQIIAKIDSTEIETHLGDVYQALAASNSTINEKLNALFYFESIIINSNVSNRLINSAFMNLLVKMLKSIKTPGIKSRLCSVVGLLIRHSTVIENELAESEICAQLVETMKEKNEKVRRKAIAALGEYMFYAATQLDDEQVDPVWELSYEATQVILRSLRIGNGENQSEDDIVRFYACKTLENICAQSNSAGQKFTTLETINHLLAIFLCPPQNFCREPNKQRQTPQFYEALKTSSAVALSHICGLNPQLFHSIFERITAPVYCNTLIEGQPRVQQAFITMLNLALTANVYPKINDILLAEESFLPSLIQLHEHHSIVIRGKCLLTFLLLFKLDFRWMSVVQNQVKFFNMLDRVLRDNYKYVQCCLLCLIDGILEIVPTIFQTVAEELGVLIQNGGQQMPRLQASEFDRVISREQAAQLKKGGSLFFVSVILDLQTNQLIRNRMLNYPFIRALSTLLDNTTLLIGLSCNPNKSTAQPQDEGQISYGSNLTSIAYEFQYTLLLIAESISTNQKVILQMHEAIISFLLPVLLSKASRPSHNFGPQSQLAAQESESRFLALKIITDILILLLSEDSIYLPHLPVDTKPATATAQQQSSTQKINQLLLQGLLPLAGQLLSGSDPEPFYGMRLLSAIFDRNIHFVKVLRTLSVDGGALDRDSASGQSLAATSDQSTGGKKVLQLITDFYQINHASLNKHTIIIVKALIEAKEISFAEMRDYRIIDKTYQLIKTMLANKHEWCIELLLDINHHLLSRFNEVVKTREKEIARHIDDIFSNFDICVQLLSDHFEVAIIEKASQCLIQMLQLYALCQEKKREIFFVETHMQFLIKALECDKKTIQKRVLKCIYWALIQSEYQIELDQAKLIILSSKVESMMESGDKSICQTSRQISKILKEQMMNQQQQQQYPQHTGAQQPSGYKTAAEYNFGKLQ